MNSSRNYYYYYCHYFTVIAVIIIKSLMTQASKTNLIQTWTKALLWQTFPLIRFKAEIQWGILVCLKYDWELWNGGRRGTKQREEGSWSWSAGKGRVSLIFSWEFFKPMLKGWYLRSERHISCGQSLTSLGSPETFASGGFWLAWSVGMIQTSLYTALERVQAFHKRNISLGLQRNVGQEKEVIGHLLEPWKLRILGFLF